MLLFIFFAGFHQILLTSHVDESLNLIHGFLLFFLLLFSNVSIMFPNTHQCCMLGASVNACCTDRSLFSSSKMPPISLPFSSPGSVLNILSSISYFAFSTQTWECGAQLNPLFSFSLPYCDSQSLGSSHYTGLSSTFPSLLFLSVNNSISVTFQLKPQP